MNKTSKGALIALSVATLFSAREAIAGSNDEAAKKDAPKVKCVGVNECAGKGECGGKGNECAGKNKCKSMGMVMLSADECKAKGGTVQQ
ncbi:MAG: hypothetical protein FJ144_15620 [Deltaproteobacteria bacterium]|nr:hypothetical protein [Deltaproteobacteria bacterium]